MGVFTHQPLPSHPATIRAFIENQTNKVVNFTMNTVPRWAGSTVSFAAGLATSVGGFMAKGDWKFVDEATDRC